MSNNRQPGYITISKEDLPSHLYEIVLREPFMSDRRMIVKRMPPPDKAGFGIEEALCSSCIVSINGKNNIQNPKDPIFALSKFSLEDSQYITNVFLEAFFCTEADQQRAKEFAKSLRSEENGIDIVYSVPCSEMPIGDISLTFCRPTMQTDIEATKLFKAGDNAGYTVDEYTFARCLRSVNGQNLPNGADLDIFDSWPCADHSYAFYVFLASSYLTREAQEKAQVLGKKKREQFLSARGSSLQQEGTTLSAPPVVPIVKEQESVSTMSGLNTTGT